MMGNIADTASSSLTRLDGSKCEDNCVYSTDALLFTCELNHIALLRVRFPNGYHQNVGPGDTEHSVALPAGFSAVSLNISKNRYRSNISLKLLIANASLLDGGEIICDDSIRKSGNNVTAGCRLCVDDGGGSNGTHDGGGGGDSTGDGSGGNGLFPDTTSRIVGVGIVIIIIGGGMLLVIFLFKKKKRRTKSVDQKMDKLSQSDPASLAVTASAATMSSAIDTIHSTSSRLPTHQRYSQLESAIPMVDIYDDVFGDIDHTYSTIPDIDPTNQWWTSMMMCLVIWITHTVLS
jgi:hypothetical protein